MLIDILATLGVLVLFAIFGLIALKCYLSNMKIKDDREDRE